LFQDFRAQFKAPGIVQIQDLDRGAADSAEPDNVYAVDCEMVNPLLAARVKKRDDLSSLRIDSRHVWTLVQIAPMAPRASSARWRTRFRVAASICY